MSFEIEPPRPIVYLLQLTALPGAEGKPPERVSSSSCDTHPAGGVALSERPMAKHDRIEGIGPLTKECMAWLLVESSARSPTLLRVNS